jgi:glycosyltransferase involved in cell wall biosynthesis
VRSIKLSISRLGPAASVALHGTVDDVAKWDLYRACDLFVLPSHSENFGSVVAEALATGLPVITTRAAPWDWLPERRAGWWVSVDAASLSQAILEATSLPAEDLGSMGLRGREECRRLFDWSAITSQFLEAYDWLLGRAGMPACVRT